MATMNPVGAVLGTLIQSEESSWQNVVFAPSWQMLNRIADQSRKPKAKQMLKKILAVSKSFVKYVRQMKEAVFSEHSIGCHCDFCLFGKKCKKFENELRNLMGHFVEVVQRAKRLCAIKPQILANKIVATATAA